MHDPLDMAPASWSFSKAPGRYRPIARIGRGGMAEVLLAASGSGRVTKLAVLKCLWPELAHDPDLVEMFLDEARLGTRLCHPNLVQTYEILHHGDRLAMAMEYLDGQPLTATFNRFADSNLLSLPLRLRILCGVLAGLHHAHTLTDYDGTPLEVVHRDVSPHNVFITYEGQVKLIDFGVAKSITGEHETRPGALKGKVAYMAPEVLRGTSVDHRSDIFSVGIILWEMLAGRRLWHRTSESSIAWRLSTGMALPALPSGVALPEGLEAICMRALAADPGERYQSAADMEDALERLLLGMAESRDKHLGSAIATAFESERSQRRALIDAHLRHTSVPPAFEAMTAPYESSFTDRFETSFTVLDVQAAASAPAAKRSPPPLPPPATPRPRSVRALALAAGTLVALGGAATVGREVHVTWDRVRFGEAEAAAAHVQLIPPLTRPALSLALPLEEGERSARAVPEDEAGDAAPPGRRRHERRGARPATGRRDGPTRLDASDDVLDLDGRPAAPPVPSAVTRSLDKTDPYGP